MVTNLGYRLGEGMSEEILHNHRGWIFYFSATNVLHNGVIDGFERCRWCPDDISRPSVDQSLKLTCSVLCFRSAIATCLIMVTHLYRKVVNRRSTCPGGYTLSAALIVAALKYGDTLSKHCNLTFLFLKLQPLTFNLFVCNSKIGERITILLC